MNVVLIGFLLFCSRINDGMYHIRHKKVSKKRLGKHNGSACFAGQRRPMCSPPCFTGGLMRFSDCLCKWVSGVCLPSTAPIPFDPVPFGRDKSRISCGTAMAEVLSMILRK